LLYGFLVSATLLYLLTVFLFKTDNAALTRYHVDDTQLKLLSLFFLIPTLVIWYAGIYSIDKIAAYTARIHTTKDGQGMRLLTRGLAVLGFGTVINSLVSRVLNYAVTQGVLDKSFATIVTNEFNVIYIFSCFFLFFLGSKHLMRTIKKTDISATSYLWVTLGTLLVSVPYVTAVLSNPYRTTVTGIARTATYAMPDWLILTIIVIPYLAAWTFGLYAVLFLRTYQKNVGGVLYKQALNKLTKGFLGLIIMTVLLQFISAVSPIILGWVLGAILLILSTLLLAIVICYLYIARGAKDLAKLEDVT
jgi:hypothetical protein